MMELSVKYEIVEGGIFNFVIIDCESLVLVIVALQLLSIDSIFL
jgi:hypothetical protein